MMIGGLTRPGKRPSCLRRRRKNHKRARDHQFRKRHFSVTETPVSHPCLMIPPKGSAVGVGDPGTTPGPAEPLFLHIGQALHQPHNNSLVSHEEFNFVLKTHKDISNLDNFVDLQNDVFTQNDNLSVFNDSYVECNRLESRSPLGKGRLAKNIKFWEDINVSPWVLRIIKEGYVLPFINEPEPAEFKNNASARIILVYQSYKSSDQALEKLSYQNFCFH